MNLPLPRPTKSVEKEMRLHEAIELKRDAGTTAGEREHTVQTDRKVNVAGCVRINSTQPDTTDITRCIFRVPPASLGRNSRGQFHKKRDRQEPFAGPLNRHFSHVNNPSQKCGNRLS